MYVKQVLNRSMDPKTYDQHQAIAPPPLIAQLPPQVQVSMIPQVEIVIK